MKCQNYHQFLILLLAVVHINLKLFHPFPNVFSSEVTWYQYFFQCLRVMLSIASFEIISIFERLISPITMGFQVV